MPDTNKAAVWFTNFMISRFKVLAKAKKYSIKNTNENFRRSATLSEAQNQHHSNTCINCSSVFNIQSKPLMCSKCHKYYHRKCTKAHSKSCKATNNPPENQTTSLPQPSSSNNSSCSITMSSVGQYPSTQSLQSIGPAQSSSPQTETYPTNAVLSPVHDQVSPTKITKPIPKKRKECARNNDTDNENSVL